MESVLTPQTRAAAPSRAEGALPWYLTACLLGSTSIVIGVLWDISWHATIGRDTFWTPAHLAIYLGGVLAGVSCGWLALKTTFGGGEAERAASVRFWGFRAPLGAWMSIWGAIAMLTSAPFDDWWHNAYGLDVEILSPPHMVLALGMIAIQIGTLLMALAIQNRVPEPLRRRLSLASAYTGGILLTMVVTLFMEHSEFNRQHGAAFYKIGSAAYPVLLAAVAVAVRLRWPATTAAASFMAIRLLMTWVLPLFPATPMLAPIFNPVDHMWPPPFPLLLIVPAVAFDLLLRRFDREGGGRSGWLLAPALGASFTGLFLLVQWHFSALMLTPAGRNRFFAADQWMYSTRIADWRYRFWDLDTDPLTPAAVAVCLLLATVSARIGLWFGAWMGKVKR
jgi:hypothetical protein